MCGIISCVVNNPTQALSNMLKLFINQKSRGVLGAGIIIKHENNNTIFTKKYLNPYTLFTDTKTLGKIKKNDIVIIHHRRPTSSPNKLRNNHPFSVTYTNKQKEVIKCSYVHNGIISNYSELLLKNHKKLSEKDYESYKEYVAYKINEETQKIEQYNEYVMTDSEVLSPYFLFKKKHDIKALLDRISCIYKEVKGYYALSLVFNTEHALILINKGGSLYTYEDNKNNKYAVSECLTQSNYNYNILKYNLKPKEFLNITRIEDYETVIITKDSRVSYFDSNAIKREEKIKEQLRKAREREKKKEQQRKKNNNDNYWWAGSNCTYKQDNLSKHFNKFRQNKKKASKIIEQERINASAYVLRYGKTKRELKKEYHHANSKISFKTWLIVNYDIDNV